MKSRITECSVVAVAVAAASNKFVCLGPELLFVEGQYPNQSSLLHPPPTAPLLLRPSLHIPQSSPSDPASVWPAPVYGSLPQALTM